jgi:predicted nucleotidyltransferase component of viral defense system
MLDLQQHEINMKRLLLEFFKNDKLKNELAFKGGTCLYFFYNLDRFSTDLDFNSLTSKLSYKEIDKIIQSNSKLKVKDKMNKNNTWFWSLSYGENTLQIKIEISKRDYPDTYEFKDLLGVKVRVMTQDCMFSHKLCAVSSRKVLQNRDLYDSLFMFKNDFPINDTIIFLRTAKSRAEYFKSLADYIKLNTNEKKILDGLGEVLEEKVKNDVKKNLLPNLIQELLLRA